MLKYCTPQILCPTTECQYKYNSCFRKISHKQIANEAEATLAKQAEDEAAAASSALLLASKKQEVERRAIFISLGVFFTYIGIQTNQGTQTIIYKDYGFLMLGIAYLTKAITSLTYPYVKSTMQFQSLFNQGGTNNNDNEGVQNNNNKTTNEGIGRVLFLKKKFLIFFSF